MKSAIALLGMSAAAYGVVNDITLGSGVAISLDADEKVPPCVNKITVAKEEAGANCKIELALEEGDAHTATALVYNYFWKKDSSDFKDSDKLKYDDDDKLKATVNCDKAGDYYLGLTVNDCGVCIAGANSKADMTAILKIDDVYTINLYDTSTQIRTPKLTLSEDEWVLFNFKLEAKGTPHFDIDKALTSSADDLDYYYVKKGEDITMEGERTAVEPSGSNKVLLENLEAGEYVFGIYAVNGITGSSTTFRVEYALNKEPDASFPEGKCFEDDCDDADLQNCADCAENNCNWCETERVCSASPKCKDEKESPVIAEDKCVDIDAECKKLENCGDCANKDGCVWCDSADFIGGGLGSCSAGKGDLGKECTSPAASAISEADKCAGNSLIMSAVAMVGVVAAMMF